MSDIILHHYAMSPFSQKIRSMLGYTQIDWQSVVTSEMPPRPQLNKLTGGYRKMPVAQIGADIFCDSKTIATEIAALSNKPQLALENCSVEVQEYAARVDLDIFFAALFTSATWKLNKKVWKSMSAMDIGRFFVDRVKIGRKASVKTAGPKDAKRVLHEHLADVEQRLESDFIFGPEPNHADFSTYHSLWFSRDLAEAGFVDQFKKVSDWMDRIASFGEECRQEITAEQSLEQAAAAEPRQIPDACRDDPDIGQQVKISPVDYAKDPTTGVLVGSSPTQWIMARKDADLGTLHVHMPKDGYRLCEA